MGGAQSNVNEKIGPRVEIGKADADDAEDADAHVLPLDFLLGVMRDPNTPPHLRLRAAGLVAPFVHSKGEPPPADGAPGEMRVIADCYGFDADLAARMESIHQDQARLRALAPGVIEVIQQLRQADIGKTTAQLELEKSIADKRAALTCPPSYKELDSRRDRARLKELAAGATKRPLAAAEETEQRHLQARVEVYSWTPEAADCEKMNYLKALSPELRSAEDDQQLERLTARYGDVPLDTTLIEDHVLLAREAIRRIRLYQQANKAISAGE